jgi:hypothetical protein
MAVTAMAIRESRRRRLRLLRRSACDDALRYTGAFVFVDAWPDSQGDTNTLTRASRALLDAARDWSSKLQSDAQSEIGTRVVVHERALVLATLWMIQG